jgi:chromosomal replication initiator protein
MLDNIVEAVASYFDITVQDIAGKSRERKHAHARSLVMYFAHLYVSNNWCELGRLFARHHTTVMSACNTITARIRKDAHLAAEVKVLRSTFLN